ncbi:helix-turn-helix transcriptional regulator, partial [Sinorhizobium meliloti]
MTSIMSCCQHDLCSQHCYVRVMSER